MRVFNNFFEGKNKIKENVGIPLESEEQLEYIMALSKKQTTYLLKHSTRCGFSKIVMNKFERRISEIGKTYFLLDVIKYRSLSNLIVDKYKVRHESPQLLIFKNDQLVKHDSHSGVLELSLI